MTVIYADNNATTQIAPEVLEAMLPYLKEHFGNPSSGHALGAQAAEAVEKARKQVAKSLGVRSSEVIFTSGGTESDNAAIHGALAARPKRRHVITTSVEHSAVFNYVRDLAAQGYAISYIPVDEDGRLDEGQLWDALRPDTALVSMMWANNETGVIFPVDRLAREIKAKYPEVVFHTDAVQAMGKIPLDLSDSAIDMLSISGHKFQAPKGVGALILRGGIRFKSLIIGGDHESGHRAGTHNAASIMGLCVACELAVRRLPDMQGRVKSMRDRLEQGLAKRIGNARVNGAKAPRVANTTSISFKGLESEPIIQALSDEGICASSGSACRKGHTEPSRVLVAMGLPKEWSLGMARFSFGHTNTEDEVDQMLEIVPRVISKLSAIASR